MNRMPEVKGELIYTSSYDDDQNTYITGPSCMFRMQCVEFDLKKVEEVFEKYNCTFAEMYENIMKLLKNKQGRSKYEQFFVDKHLNEEFDSKGHHIDPGFFTIFTRMYPEITFRLFEITNNMQSCSIYIFKGDQYVLEKGLRHDRSIIEIDCIKFRNKNCRIYDPKNLNIILDIMEIYLADHMCAEVVGESSEPYNSCLHHVIPVTIGLSLKKFDDSI